MISKLDRFDDEKHDEWRQLKRDYAQEDALSILDQLIDPLAASADDVRARALGLTSAVGAQRVDTFAQASRKADVHIDFQSKLKQDPALDQADI